MKTLIVDDHPLVADATRALLDSIDRIEVIGVVSNGPQCMEQIALHQPGLVFLDYHLPGQSGMAVAAQIRRDYPHTYIVLFTGGELVKGAVSEIHRARYKRYSIQGGGAADDYEYGELYAGWLYDAATFRVSARSIKRRIRSRGGGAQWG
ncbi:response regulator [Paenibacillus sp. SYP-B4298]|uniref:response regulator n=1 Tax=Paenibacillus sp. SYP-B4298 TaxID=2996034 RepID=UPI0022DE26B8|nr:response regulator transcription factor [Paenibacillus sp. SYP-B4298]